MDLDRHSLRQGWTTGACAAAATWAAVYRLLTGLCPTHSEIVLPNGNSACFALARVELSSQGVLAGVVKDGGDDPDCTHGLEIQCLATRISSGEFHHPVIDLRGGEGVATVTLPGLELPIGEAAINPVPRAHILQIARELLAEYGDGCGLRLEIRVPGGEQAAKETISERLGLIGGISILGTRGTVRPYSTCAFAASVKQSVQVARAVGWQEVVLTTGSRTERAARQLFTHLTGSSVIQAGDFVGMGLRAARHFGCQRVRVVAMIGKLCKLATGQMMTHVSGKAIDFAALALLAEELGLNDFSAKVQAAHTGRHLLELSQSDLAEDVSQRYLAQICDAAAEHGRSYVGHACQVDIYLVDFSGRCLAQSKEIQ
ncbi:cobalt-precorrin-5B (C(1))-methyltransferase [Celerinatantimonas sp. YJH-8]|uniref:cobalt-precorrin-5B (C(1))-methyltransferase n=1 Tax=Celerinatantimonas sp. YJH-8 TaxID=3228714 RepID=UPI0038C06559